MIHRICEYPEANSAAWAGARALPWLPPAPTELIRPPRIVTPTAALPCMARSFIPTPLPVSLPGSVLSELLYIGEKISPIPV